jgi:hypothetical protein
MPGSGSPDRGGDVRGIFSNVSAGRFWDSNGANGCPSPVPPCFSFSLLGFTTCYVPRRDLHVRHRLVLVISHIHPPLLAHIPSPPHHSATNP